MHGNNLYDPGLHLFVDNEGVQDHPGFQRKVQRPQPVQAGPVLRPDRPWEGYLVLQPGTVLEVFFRFRRSGGCLAVVIEAGGGLSGEVEKLCVVAGQGGFDFGFNF